MGRNDLHIQESSAPAGKWWLDRDRVKGYVYGVFEGGGAKGIVYAGALKGLLRRKSK